jgi:hypothetical protein
LSQGDFSRRKKRFVLGCPTRSRARPIKDENENRRVSKDRHPSSEFAQEKSSRTNIMRLDSLTEQAKSISPVTPDKFYKRSQEKNSFPAAGFFLAVQPTP